MAFEFLAGKKHLSCFLVTIQTPDGVFYRIVDEKSFSIGRALECALSFPDPNISRVHIVVSAKKDQVWLIDQGSANGTYVNDQKIMANKMTLVQPADVIKLGSSEIRLKFDIFEKNFKQDDLINSLLPDNEKSALMEVVQAAHQQAKRILLQAQEHSDKVMRAAEVKVRNVENNLLIKQDEILQAANVQGNQLIQESKRKAAQIVFDAEEKALENTKNIFDKAEATKAAAEKFYQEKVQESQLKADEIVQHHTNMGQQILQEAREKSQEIRKIANDEGEKIKEAFIEKAKVEMQTQLAELIADVKNAQADLEYTRTKKEKEIELEIDKKRQEMELSLSDIKNELVKLKDQKDSELQKCEHETQLLLRKRELDLEQLNLKKEDEFKRKVEDLSFSITKQEKELAFIIENREREIKKRETELEQLFQNHQLAIEQHTADKERAMRERVDQELSDKKMQVNDLDSHINTLKGQISNFENQKESVSSQISSLSLNLEELKGQIQQTLNEKKSTENSYQELLKQIEQFDNEKKLASDKVKDLESRAAHLQMSVESDSRKIQDLNHEYESKVKEYKLKLDAEFQQLRKDKEQQFRDSLNAETENAKMLKNHLLQEVLSKQNIIVQDIHQKVLKILANQVPKENLSSLSEISLKQIKASFEENIASISAQNQAGKINTADIVKKQQELKFRWVGAGLTVGLVLMGLFHVWDARMRQRTLASVMEEEQRQRSRELEDRKFNPPQDLEVRETYTDSVIYTKDFPELYADAQIQERWVRESQVYFFKNWRIEEDKTIEVLSIAKTLVQELNEKRKNIHPDFVAQNIQKMKEYENESVVKMKAILGTDVKYEAFKRFEKKFYMNELARRSPSEVYIDPNTEGTK